MNAEKCVCCDAIIPEGRQVCPSCENKKPIYAEDLFTVLRDDINISGANLARIKRHINNAPAVDVISVTEIEAYLQARLDEWNALGDRKWEPANMWGYNFIMACFDDLERRDNDG